MSAPPDLPIEPRRVDRAVVVRSLLAARWRRRGGRAWSPHEGRDRAEDLELARVEALVEEIPPEYWPGGWWQLAISVDFARTQDEEDERRALAQRPRTGQGSLFEGHGERWTE